MPASLAVMSDTDLVRHAGSVLRTYPSRETTALRVEFAARGLKRINDAVDAVVAEEGAKEMAAALDEVLP